MEKITRNFWNKVTYSFTYSFKISQNIAKISNICLTFLGHGDAIVNQINKAFHIIEVLLY